MLGSCSHSVPMHKLCTAARVEEGKSENLCYDLIHILSKIANFKLKFDFIELLYKEIIIKYNQVRESTQYQLRTKWI